MLFFKRRQVTPPLYKGRQKTDRKNNKKESTFGFWIHKKRESLNKTCCLADSLLLSAYYKGSISNFS